MAKFIKVFHQKYLSFVLPIMLFTFRSEICELNIHLKIFGMSATLSGFWPINFCFQSNKNKLTFFSKKTQPGFLNKAKNMYLVLNISRNT